MLRHDSNSPYFSPVLAVVVGGRGRLFIGQTPVLGGADMFERGVEAVVGRISSRSGRHRSVHRLLRLAAFGRQGLTVAVALGLRARAAAAGVALGLAFRRLAVAIALPVRTLPPVANSVILTGRPSCCLEERKVIAAVRVRIGG